MLGSQSSLAFPNGVLVLLSRVTVEGLAEDVGNLRVGWACPPGLEQVQPESEGHPKPEKTKQGDSASLPLSTSLPLGANRPWAGVPPQ